MLSTTSLKKQIPSSTPAAENYLGTAGKGTTFESNVNPSEPAVFNSSREPLTGLLVSTSPSCVQFIGSCPSFPRNPLSPLSSLLNNVLMDTPQKANS